MGRRHTDTHSPSADAGRRLQLPEANRAAAPRLQQHRLNHFLPGDLLHTSHQQPPATFALNAPFLMQDGGNWKPVQSETSSSALNDENKIFQKSNSVFFSFHLVIYNCYLGGLFVTLIYSEKDVWTGTFAQVCHLLKSCHFYCLKSERQ